MKTYFKTMALWGICLTIFFSCKKMDDSYRQFFENGETIYIGKADSVITRGGNERIELSWLLLSDPKVSSYKLYWNNYQDSVLAEVTKTDQVDTIKVLLENMAEGLHHFEIIMYDKLGNHSVPNRVSGRVYGEQYSSYLVNRIFNDPKMLGGGAVELNWTPAEDELLYTEIEYDNTENEKVRHIVDREAKLDTLKLFPAGGTLHMFSAYKPDSLALDTFYSKIEEFTPSFVPVEVDKGLMKHHQLDNDYYVPSFETRPLSNLWDGPSTANGNNFTLGTDASTSFPWWYTIDLGRKYQLQQLKFLSSPAQASHGYYSFFFDNTSPKIFEVWGSNDPTDDGSWDSWTLLDRFESVKPSGLPLGQHSAEDIATGLAGEDFIFSEDGEAYQYIRVNVIDSWASRVGFIMQEMTLWGFPIE